ncbi:MAG: sugar phosphate isomerase/epimerase [Planctomycetota bacterium]|nr:sugar phosphate isomerase/epimerase [Planctomycetota bacterium]
MKEIHLSCYAGIWGADGVIQAISDVSHCGFEGLEFPADIVFHYEDRIHVFEEILEDSRLRLSGLIQKVNLIDKENADEQVERAANSARFVGAISRGSLIVCQAVRLETAPADDDWLTIAAILEEIGCRCRDFGINLCFLPRARYFGDSDQDLRRLLAMTPPEAVHLAVDSAELTAAGMNPGKIIRTHADRLKMVRLRDLSGAKRRQEGSGAVPQFGRGKVDFEAVSKALADIGYEGWITLDVTGEAAQPKDAALASHRFIMRRSGLFPY